VAQITNKQTNEGHMKKAKTETRKQAGRNPFIHKLNADGVGKVDAREKTQAKFPCSDADFEKVWNAKPRGANGGKTPPAKKVKTAKPPAAPATPPPPTPAAPATV